MREWTSEAPNLSGALEIEFEVDGGTAGIRGSALRLDPFAARRKPAGGEFWLVWLVTRGRGLASSEQVV